MLQYFGTHQCKYIVIFYEYAGCSDAALTHHNGTVHTARCADKGFVDSLSISGGVVCYNGTTIGSVAIYICNDGFVLMGVEARVCQNDGSWNGSIPQCILEEAGVYIVGNSIHFRMIMHSFEFCVSRGGQATMCASGSVILEAQDFN